MNNKVEELVGRVKLTGEEANQAFDDAFDKPVEFDHKPTPEEIITLRLLAVAQAATDKALNDPDLALINREKEKPRIHYDSYLSIKGGDERIIGWELHERRMKEEGFTYSIIPLAEALKKNSENVEKRHCSECNWEGLENETGFGHDDFYCPICLRETLDICEVKQ